MSTEAEKRYKRAHWRASRTLIERHRGEFLQLLDQEQRAEEPAEASAARPPLPTRRSLELLHHANGGVS